MSEQITAYGVSISSREAEQGSARVVRSFAEISEKAHGTTSAVDNFQRKLDSAGRTIAQAFAAFKLAQWTRETIDLADAYTNMNARLSLVTTGSGNLARVQSALFASAQNARTQMEATTELYARMARNASQLGASQSDLLTVTDAINKSMVISGASAASSQAALVQLGQSFASGTLRGEELNSVMEQAPRLAQAIATGLGVSIGKLRTMGAAGELTGRQVFGAIQKSAAGINSEFGKIPVTVAGAMTQLRNAALMYVGGVDTAEGASAKLAASITGLSENIGTVVQSVTVIAGLLAGRWVGGMLEANRSTLTLVDSVVRGNSVMLGSVEAQRGAAAAAVQRAEAQRVAAAESIAALHAERAAIMEVQVAERQRLATAATRVRGAVPESQLAPLGGAVAARDNAAVAIAMRERAAAQQTLIAMGQRAASTDLELAAAARTLAATELQVTAAQTARTAVMARTSLAARAATAATAGFSTVMAALGGPIGVAMLAAVGLNAVLDIYLDRVTKAAEQTDKQRDATDRALDAAHRRAAGERKLAQELTEAQKKAAESLRDVRNAGVLARIEAQREFDAVGMAEDARARYNLETERMLALKRADQTLSGAALIAQRQAINGTFAIRDATLLAIEAFERLRNTVQAPEFEMSGIVRGMQEAKRVIEDLAKAAQAPGFELGAVTRGMGIANDIIASGQRAKLLAKEMQRDFADAFFNIATRGIQTFRDLFGSVKDMFLRVVSDIAAANLMEKITKSGAVSKISDSLGGFGLGALALGIGAVTAGFSYLTGRSKEAAEALERMRKSALDAVQDYTRTGESDRDKQQREAMKAFNDVIEKLREAYREGAITSSEYVFQAQQAIEARDRELQRIADATDALGKFVDAAEAARKAMEAQREMEDMEVRHLIATGQVTRGGDIAFQNQQRREYEDAKAAGKSPEFLAFLTRTQVEEAIQRAQTAQIERQTKVIEDAEAARQAQFQEQIKVAEGALDVAQDQLRAQEQAVQATQRVIDSLREYAAGLSLNTSLTTLSPVQQLAEARRQFEDLLARARGGDRDAAGNLSGAGNAYLTASRAVNASSAGYVQDYLNVQNSVKEMQAQFGQQLTVEQQILAELKAQTISMQQQITELQNAAAASAASAQAAMAAVASGAYSSNAQLNLLSRVLEFLSDPNQGHGVDNTSGGARTLDTLTFGSAMEVNRYQASYDAQRQINATYDVRSAVLGMGSGADSADRVIAWLADPNNGHNVDNTSGGAPSLDAFVSADRFESTIATLADSINVPRISSSDSSQDALIDALRAENAELRSSLDYQTTVFADGIRRLEQRLDSIGSVIDDGNRITQRGFEEAAVRGSEY